MHSPVSAGVVVLLLAASPAAGQSTPVEALALYRQHYPERMSPAQIGALLNHVAWDYRAQGMRLLGKASGHTCPTPTGVSISCDYLLHEPSRTGHDVLTDNPSRNGIVVGFTWGPGREDLTDVIRTGERTIVNPTLPDGATGTGGVVPLPPGTGAAVDFDELIRRQAVLEHELLLVRGIAEETLEQLKEHRQAGARMWLKVSAIGGPAIALLTAVLMREPAK